MKRIAIFLIIGLITTLVGCGNDLKNKAVEQGKLALANKEYDKALASFDLAIDEGAKDKELSLIINILNDYLNAKSSYEKGDIDNAKTLISNINENYKNYSIKNDIEALKENINNYKVEENIKEDNNTEDSSKENTPADSSVETNKENTNNDSIESKREDYFNKCINLENRLKVELESKYSTGVTVDLIEAANTEYKNWDDLLNEIYGVLKEQLSATDMESIKNEQINWISIRDAKAEESASEVKGGTLEPVFYTNSLTESTKNRCYELIEKYMK